MHAQYAILQAEVWFLLAFHYFHPALHELTIAAPSTCSFDYPPLPPASFSHNLFAFHTHVYTCHQTLFCSVFYLQVNVILKFGEYVRSS